MCIVLWCVLCNVFICVLLPAGNILVAHNEQRIKVSHV